jgi:hypothetical protein
MMVTHFLASTYDASSLPIPGINHAVTKGPRVRNPWLQEAGRRSRGSSSQETRRWRKRDSNLYGAFPVKRLFWVVLTVFCSERERPFFVPSPAIRFAERAEGVKGPKR